MVEHYLDTVGVTGSNPVSRTIFQQIREPLKAPFLLPGDLPEMEVPAIVASFRSASAANHQRHRSESRQHHGSWLRNRPELETVELRADAIIGET